MTASWMGQDLPHSDDEERPPPATMRAGDFHDGAQQRLVHTILALKHREGRGARRSPRGSRPRRSRAADPRWLRVSYTNRAPFIDSITARTRVATTRLASWRRSSVSRGRKLRDQLPGIVDMAHVQSTSTQIQSSVRHA